MVAQYSHCESSARLVHASALGSAGVQSEHALRHAVSMKAALRSHSPEAAQPAHSSVESRHASAIPSSRSTLWMFSRVFRRVRSMRFVSSPSRSKRSRSGLWWSM